MLAPPHSLFAAALRRTAPLTVGLLASSGTVWCHAFVQGEAPPAGSITSDQGTDLPAQVPPSSAAGAVVAGGHAAPVLASRAQDSSVAGAEPVSAPPSAVLKEPPALQGWISLDGRSRWTDDDEDHDAYLLISLDYGAARHAPLTAHVMGRVAADLDGASDPASPFTSLADTLDGSVDGQLYHAYLDYAPIDGKLAVRAGRQLDTRMPALLRLDGLALRTQPLGAQAIEVGAYGGVPVHFYESSSSGDLALGTYAEARPWKGGRARFDWMHFDDERQFGEFQDDLIGLGAWQNWSEWSADAQYTRLENESRDLRLHLQHVGAKSGAVARLTYYELFQTQSAQSLELDPFSTTLQDWYPFRQAGATYSTPITDHLDLDLGADLRRVRDEDDVGEFNRDWERYRATAILRELGLRGLSLSVTGDLWYGDGQDTTTWGADATLEPDRAWRFSLGSEYALYKYDLYGQNERDDVRVWYGRARCKCSDALSLELGYEYEDADFEQFQTLRWGAQWRF